MIDETIKSNLTAIVVLSMILTPLLGIVVKRLIKSNKTVSLDDVEIANDLHGRVLLIGFGRFGQVASQLLLARGVDVTLIDTDINMIQNATKFGFKIYYGDGTRLDILHASGAAHAQAIMVCVDDKNMTNKIVELVKHEFPLAKLLVRSYDREHSLSLVKHDVDYQIRETFESALLFGGATLDALGVDAEEIRNITKEIRELDKERFETEIAADDVEAGIGFQFSNTEHQPRPTSPLVKPKTHSQLLNDSNNTDVK